MIQLINRGIKTKFQTKFFKFYYEGKTSSLFCRHACRLPVVENAVKCF